MITYKVYSDVLSQIEIGDGFLKAGQILPIKKSIEKY